MKGRTSLARQKERGNAMNGVPSLGGGTEHTFVRGRVHNSNLYTYLIRVIQVTGTSFLPLLHVSEEGKNANEMDSKYPPWSGFNAPCRA